MIDYFLKRGHTQVTAFVPEWRRYTPRPGSGPIQDQYLLNQMQENGHLVFTPARRINNRIIASYDDRLVFNFVFSEFCSLFKWRGGGGVEPKAEFS